MSVRASDERYGRCIFCGDLKRRTEEHIWPVWMRPYLIAKLLAHGRASVEVRGNESTELSRVISRGDPQRLSVLGVCADCNNGWMSRLQERARRELLAVIERQSFTLLKSGQRVLAAWAAMSVMVGEHFWEGAIAIPPVYRLSMKLTSSVPARWKIWMGSFERGNWPAYLAHGTTVLPADDGAHVDPTGPNTQASTFTVGPVLFHAFSCQSSRFVEELELECEGRLLQIWPPTASIEWPPPQLTSLQADRIAAVIFDALARRRFQGLSINWIRGDQA